MNSTLFIMSKNIINFLIHFKVTYVEANVCLTYICIDVSQVKKLLIDNKNTFRK